MNDRLAPLLQPGNVRLVAWLSLHLATVLHLALKEQHVCAASATARVHGRTLGLDWKTGQLQSSGCRLVCDGCQCATAVHIAGQRYRCVLDQASMDLCM